MKKIVVLPAMALALMFTVNTTAQDRSMQKSQQQQAQQEASAQQVEYKKIDKAKLPAAVKEAVERDLRGAEIAEVHAAEDNTYKLILNMNGEKKAAYADADGNWIQPRQ